MENAVEISLGVNFYNISTGKYPRSEQRVLHYVGFKFRKAVFWCENANLLRNFEQGIPEKVDLGTCRARIKHKSITYVADNADSYTTVIWPEMPEEPVEALVVKNLDVSKEEWISKNLWMLRGDVIDTVHIIYDGREYALFYTLNDRNK